jgi:hypothetical protein
LLETLLAHLVARTTPFTLSDARLLVELAREASKALLVKGVLCPYGTDGTHRGKALCMPGRWKDGDLAEHDRTCRHCPVFRRLRDKATANMGVR